VRTAFHDAVARFGGSVVARSGVVFPPSRFAETTSDTPVAIRPLNLPEGRSSRSFRRDQFTPHRVNDAELPRPGVPSPFSRWPIARQPARDRSLGVRGAMQHNT